MKYKTCTDYWLNTDNMTLRGEFEEMYRDIDDPWGCQQGAHSLNNRILGELLFHDRKFERIIDIGCGLGGFTSYIFGRNGGEVVGCDISPTAIEKVSNVYRQIRFVVKDILKDDISDLGIFDLVIMSEIIWYILDGIEEVFEKINNVLSERGIIGIHQYFPANQRFGNGIVNGLEGFEEFLEKKSNFKFSNKIVSFGNDGRVLLAALEKRRK